MNFSINYVEKATAVLKEAFQLKKYKAMPIVLAIFVGIFMLPLAVASAVLGVLLYVLGYLFSVMVLPVQSVHKLLHDEGQSVKHATQFLVYLVSWGFVFISYVTLSFFIITLTVLYSLFSIFTYLWTLGGFKFHLFATEENIAIEVDGKYNILIPIIFISIIGVLLVIVPLIRSGIFLIENQLPIEMFGTVFKAAFHETDTWRYVIAALYSAILFAPGPKKAEK